MDDLKSCSQASNPCETHAPYPGSELETSDGWKEKMDQLVVEGKYTYDDFHGCYIQCIEPSEVPDGETFVTVSRRWEEHLANFQQSECWTTLKDGLTQHFAPHDIPRLDNAVCIALGSLSSIGQRTRSLEDRSASLNQLAEFVSVLRLLGELTATVPTSRATTTPATKDGDTTTGIEPEISQKSTPLAVYAQEPRFNHLDKELLTSLGITVVVDPAAWELMGKNSIVYSPGAEACHFDHVAHMRPGMWWPIKVNYMDYVRIMFPGDTWDDLPRTHHRVDYTESEWTPELLNGPKSSALLEDETEYVFEETKVERVYVRKPSEELESIAGEKGRDGDATLSN